MTTFLEFLRSRLSENGFATEDVLVCFLPLLRRVIQTHESENVAPLDLVGHLRLKDGGLSYDLEQELAQRRNFRAINRALHRQTGGVDVVGRSTIVHDIGNPDRVVESAEEPLEDAEVGQPQHLPGYACWEHQAGHHDPTSDVYSLGLILVSLACGLDLTREDDFRSFVKERRNLFNLNPDLHPVLARTIVLMTELNRHDRPQNLPALLVSLENYRDQDVDFETDLASEQQSVAGSPSGKRQVILRKLQERLFEINRRNRLLHFKTTLQTLNLTHASLPIAFDAAQIREEEVLTWSGEFQSEALRQKPVWLNRFLNFQEAVYVPGQLDRLRIEARRDQTEYGFAQLRLIICFLRWSDLKASPVERYESPLLLLPATLDVRKGIHDRYSLKVADDQAEVNPVIRHLFQQLYNIELPARVGADEKAISAFYETLRERIQESDKSVELARIDKPRIALIQEKAKRRLKQFQRRARSSGRGVRQYLDLDYSYDRISYQPLGLQIFENFIVPAKTRLESIVTDSPPTRRYFAENTENGQEFQTAEKSFYSLENPEGDNPYHWEFDLCSVTLSNLRYRRMSLVNDYTQLVADNTCNDAFEATFSISPTERPDPDSSPPQPVDRHHVVPCDPTQTAAVQHARSGQSYIIQGPPGTGKSQTITNLIADFVVRGRRVLFVCEKRAAIDVVFHRLRQQGLAHLTCLIHDSQADKKQFVMDLKDTYENLLNGSSTTDPDADRQQCVEELERATEPVADFGRVMTAVIPNTQICVRDLISRLIETDIPTPTLSETQQERLPDYGQVEKSRLSLQQFSNRLKRIKPDGVLSTHPLALLHEQVATVEHPIEYVSSFLDECLGETDRLSEIIQQLQSISSVHAAFLTWDRVYESTRFAESLRFLAEADQLSLTLSSGAQQDRLNDHLARLKKCDASIAQAQSKTERWRSKLTSDDTAIALEQARRFDGSVSRFFSPAYWRLRKLLNNSYDFSAHAVQPSWTQVLQQLDVEHERRADRYEALNEIQAELHIDGDFDEFYETLLNLREDLRQAAPHHRQLLDDFLQTGNSGKKALALADLEGDLSQLGSQLDHILQDYRHLSLSDIRARLGDIGSALSDIPGFLHCMESLREADAKPVNALRTLPLSVEQLDVAAADETLNRIFRSEREAEAYSGRERSDHVAEIERAYKQLQQVNASHVSEVVSQRFQDNIRLCSTPAAQLTPEQKALKKTYNAGRRGLEHEFGKSMRYKAIREIATGETGRVLQDLKPIWLMSPLSVSDTLPLDGDSFDVVIFDEASQITLEEAIPSLFRASQTIVVGDEMQLPPTSFFSSRRDEEDDELTFEEEGQVVQYDLNSNSFLNHSSRNLPTRTLGWHYRSRSESLISFSNHAFYRGRLLTVPEESLPTQERPELTVAVSSDAATHGSEVTRRPLSFHFCEHGLYEKRKNRPEAEYIAELVRQILGSHGQLTIGIVAFSEAQQEEIQRSLRNLADQDPDFAEELDAALEREVDGQFAGLLVKNLENIQGDERDVIIMSVCYGPDRDGQVRMNFGPINLSGGEKRLNVAFSRAKHHMALVSSIRSSAITNDHNDGANCLKNYLRYAEESSRGNSAAAMRVLEAMSGVTDSGASNKEPLDPLV